VAGSSSATLGPSPKRSGLRSRSPCYSERLTRGSDAHVPADLDRVYGLATA